MHEADNTYSIQSTWLCYWMVRFLKVAYNGKHCILDLLLIYCILDLLLIYFFPIWSWHSDSVVSLDVEPDNQALTSYEMFSSFSLASF